MKTISLYETPENTHECPGFDLIILPDDDRIGTVADGASCWKCGTGTLLIPIGTRVSLPDEFKGTWVDAARLDEVEPNSTRVSPYSLVRLDKEQA